VIPPITTRSLDWTHWDAAPSFTMELVYRSIHEFRAAALHATRGATLYLLGVHTKYFRGGLWIRSWIATSLSHSGYGQDKYI
jgi:hypothetical protein